jgi:hypothetical protein
VGGQAQGWHRLSLEVKSGEMMSTRIARWVAAGVSAALFVSRHGKHRQHVRRNVLHRRGSHTQWVRVGQGRLTSVLVSPLLTVRYRCALWLMAR